MKGCHKENIQADPPAANHQELWEADGVVEPAQCSVSFLLPVRHTQSHGKLLLPGPDRVADLGRTPTAGRPCECETSTASQFHNEARWAETRLLHKRIQEPIIPAMNPCSIVAQSACRSQMMANLTPHEGVFVHCTKFSNYDGSTGDTSTEQSMD